MNKCDYRKNMLVLVGLLDGVLSFRVTSALTSQPREALQVDISAFVGTYTWYLSLYFYSNYSDPTYPRSITVFSISDVEFSYFLDRYVEVNLGSIKQSEELNVWRRR